MVEMEATLYEKITALCATGDQLAENREYEDAITQYNAAWKLVPEPKSDWDASTWILAAIADACYSSGYNTSAREALEYGMTCPGGVGNPFMHLRLGQILLDQGENDRAADELMRAYMGAGKDIFEAESPTYFEFLKTRANL